MADSPIYELAVNMQKHTKKHISRIKFGEENAGDKSNKTSGKKRPAESDPEEGG